MISGGGVVAAHLGKEVTLYGRDADTASIDTLLITQQVAQTKLARLFTSKELPHEHMNTSSSSASYAAMLISVTHCLSTH